MDDLDWLRTIFRDESRGKLVELTLYFDGLAAEGGDRNPEEIERCLRSLHNMKGSAEVVGLEEISRLACALEGAVVCLEQGIAVPSLQDLAPRAIALIGSLLDGDGAAATVDRLVSQLEASTAAARQTP